MTLIDWKKLPNEPWEVLEEETYLIFLPKSGRAITAQHDAMNHYFTYTTDDTEHIYPYRYISHYAEMDWPDDGKPMISFCEHDNMFECDECAKRHRPTA